MTFFSRLALAAAGLILLFSGVPAVAGDEDIAVVMDWIVLESADMAKILSPDAKHTSDSIYKAVLDRVDEGAAKIAQTQFLRVRSGQNAIVVAESEHVYRSTLDGLADGFGGWEWRGGGMDVNVLAGYIVAKDVIALRIDWGRSELGGFENLSEVRFKDRNYASRRVPKFFTTRTGNSAQIANGGVLLGCVYSPHGESGEPDTKLKTAVFIRAKVIRP